MIGRRGFITGMVSLVAAPAIVRVASIMPVKVMLPFEFSQALPVIHHYGPEYVGTRWPSGEPCLGAPTAAWLERNGRFDHLAAYLAAQNAPPSLIMDYEFSHIERCA